MSAFADMRVALAELELVQTEEKYAEFVKCVIDFIDQDETQIRALRRALEDALAGWRYIRSQHGDLSGVGWDRVEHSASAVLHETAID